MPSSKGQRPRHNSHNAARQEAHGVWGLHWFRRDLRLCGNEALLNNCHQHDGRVLGLFCFDAKFLARADFSHTRFAFFLKTLRALREEMRTRGGDLLIVDGLAKDVFPQLIQYFDSKSIPRPQLISWGRDYEPFARARDAQVEKILEKLKISFTHTRDHLLLEPHEIFKENIGDFYQMYSPFGRKWFHALESDKVRERVRAQISAMKDFRKDKKIFAWTWDSVRKEKFPYTDQLENFEKQNKKQVSIDIPEAGFGAAQEHLEEFKQKVSEYKTERDYPAVEGTSRLSMYLKNGSIVSSQILAEILPAHRHLDWQSKSGLVQFVKEIAWREFYYSILFHRPDVEKQSFLPQYQNLAWKNNKTWFEKWQRGQTGFPIVDAGMRELLTTGWMHNRVRMIVASFLTKDLLIDWRWGENHFMKYLLDGDLAPNNGGWQWAASTGCDPQPYFRIFNPWLQSKKFDPDGEYIRKYIPELKNVPAKHLHVPDGDRPKTYPKPIVSHEAQRHQALRLYVHARAQK